MDDVEDRDRPVSDPDPPAPPVATNLAPDLDRPAVTDPAPERPTASKPDPERDKALTGAVEKCSETVNRAMLALLAVALFCLLT